MGHGVRWIALAIVLSGMRCEEFGSIGKQGHYNFLLDGPASDSPVLGPVLDSGAHISMETIAIDAGACHAGATPYVAVESSDPAVVTFAVGSDSTIVARTGLAGSAELRLLDAQNHVVDSIGFEVQSAASLQFVDAVPPVQVIAAGSAIAYTFDVTAFDPSGVPLSGDQSPFLFTATDGLSVSSDGSGCVVESFATGSATLTATVDGLSTTLAIDSITLADVASIYVEDGPTYENGNVWSVSYLPLTPDSNAVLGAGCTWQLSDPTAQVVSDTPAYSVTDTNVAEFMTVPLPPAPVDVTATCTIGSASTTVTLSR